MDTDQAEFRLNSLAGFSLDSLGDLFVRVTNLAHHSGAILSRPYKWFLAIIKEELDRRESLEAGLLCEAGMPRYPMDRSWSAEELKDFITTLSVLSYSDLDEHQSDFIDQTLWYVTAEICSRLIVLEKHFRLESYENVA
jgi:hypothetical protein